MLHDTLVGICISGPGHHVFPLSCPDHRPVNTAAVIRKIHPYFELPVCIPVAVQVQGILQESDHSVFLRQKLLLCLKEDQALLPDLRFCPVDLHSHCLAGHGIAAVVHDPSLYCIFTFFAERGEDPAVLPFPVFRVRPVSAVYSILPCLRRKVLKLLRGLGQSDLLRVGPAGGRLRRALQHHTARRIPGIAHGQLIGHRGGILIRRIHGDRDLIFHGLPVFSEEQRQPEGEMSDAFRQLHAVRIIDCDPRLRRLRRSREQRARQVDAVRCQTDLAVPFRRQLFFCKAASGCLQRHQAVLIVRAVCHRKISCCHCRSLLREGNIPCVLRLAAEPEQLARSGRQGYGLQYAAALIQEAHQDIARLLRRF